MGVLSKKKAKATKAPKVESTMTKEDKKLKREVGAVIPHLGTSDVELHVVGTPMLDKKTRTTTTRFNGVTKDGTKVNGYYKNQENNEKVVDFKMMKAVAKKKERKTPQ